MPLVSGIRKVGRGAANGIIAFIFGLGVTFLGIGYRVDRILQGTGIDEAQAIAEASRYVPETWKIISWLFYSTHFMQIRIETVTVLKYSLHESTAWNMLYFFIPVTTTLVSGFLSVSQMESFDRLSRILLTLGLALGYGLAGVILLIFSVWTNSNSALIVPVRIMSDYTFPIFIIYPLIFGSIGGKLKQKMNSGEKGSKKADILIALNQLYYVISKRTKLASNNSTTASSSEHIQKPPDANNWLVVNNTHSASVLCQIRCRTADDLVVDMTMQCPPDQTNLGRVIPTPEKEFEIAVQVESGDNSQQVFLPSTIEKIEVLISESEISISSGEQQGVADCDAHKKSNSG